MNGHLYNAKPWRAIFAILNISNYPGMDDRGIAHIGLFSYQSLPPDTYPCINNCWEVENQRTILNHGSPTLLNNDKSWFIGMVGMVYPGVGDHTATFGGREGIAHRDSSPCYKPLVHLTNPQLTMVTLPVMHISPSLPSCYWLNSSTGAGAPPTRWTDLAMTQRWHRPMAPWL